MSHEEFRIEMPQGGMNSCTVVSILPVAIEETKPGVTPGIFKMPAAKPGDFEILVIGPSHFSVDMGEGRPSFRVSQHPTILAQSIVMDYKVAHILYVPGVSEPGLFWVPGELTKQQVKSIHAKELAKARELQDAWYVKLIESADDNWSRNRQYRSITDLMRLAGQAMKLERDWLLEHEIEESLSECPMCHAKVHPQAIICMSCNFILKPAEYEENKARFAK